MVGANTPPRKREGWRQKQNRYMNLSIRVIENEFKETYDKWVNVHTDDRGTFCRQYEIIIEETENMKQVKSNFIQVAFDDAVHDYKESMRETITFFKGETTRTLEPVEWVDDEGVNHIYVSEPRYYQGAF